MAEVIDEIFEDVSNSIGYRYKYGSVPFPSLSLALLLDSRRE